MQLCVCVVAECSRRTPPRRARTQVQDAFSKARAEEKGGGKQDNDASSMAVRPLLAAAPHASILNKKNFQKGRGELSLRL